MRLHLLGCLVLLVATAGGASELDAVEVLQPIDIDNAICVSTVTFVGYFGGGPRNNALTSVLKTCDSSAVLPPYEPDNRNSAFRAGLKIRSVETSTSGDTVRVVLDARSLSGMRPRHTWPDTTILAATAQCILVNASRNDSTRFVDLRVEGKRDYRRFGGVISTRRYRHGPLKRYFQG